MRLLLVLMCTYTTASEFKSKLDGTGIKDVEAGELKPTKETIPPEQAMKQAMDGYERLFNTLRQEQTGYAEKIFSKAKYSDRYRMTKVLLDEVFSTLRAAQRNISDINLAELPAFPLHNQTILRDLTVVWEKTALLGDLTLRLPDLVHAQCDNHNVRMSVAEWAITLCETAPPFEGVHGTQLGLVRQELHIAAEVDPKYKNPFSETNLKEQKLEHMRKQKAEQKAEDRLEKKQTRGPSLSQLRSEF